MKVLLVKDLLTPHEGYEKLKKLVEEKYPIEGMTFEKFGDLIEEAKEIYKGVKMYSSKSGFIEKVKEKEYSLENFLIQMKKEGGVFSSIIKFLSIPSNKKVYFDYEDGIKQDFLTENYMQSLLKKRAVSTLIADIKEGEEGRYHKLAYISCLQRDLFDIELNKRDCNFYLSKSKDINKYKKEEIEEIIKKGFEIEAKIDNFEVFNVKISSKGIVLKTIYAKQSEKHSWNREYITYALPIEELDSIVGKIESFEVEDKLISKIGDPSHYKEGFLEILKEDAYTMSRVLNDIKEYGKYGILEITEDEVFINGKLIVDDLNDEEFKSLLKDEKAMKLIESKFDETESFYDYCYDNDSDFWTDLELGFLCGEVFSEEPSHWCVSGSNVNWRNSCFDNNVVFNESFEDIMKRVVSGPNDYTLEVYKVYNKNELYAAIYHHDCPTGAGYTIRDFRSYVEEWDISDMTALRAGLKSYSKEYLGEHFFNDKVFLKTDLIYEIAVEQQIDNPESFKEEAKPILKKRGW